MFKTVRKNAFRKNGEAKRGNCFNRKYCIDDFARFHMPAVP